MPIRYYELHTLEFPVLQIIKEWFPFHLRIQVAEFVWQNLPSSIITYSEACHIYTDEFYWLANTFFQWMIKHRHPFLMQMLINAMLICSLQPMIHNFHHIPCWDTLCVWFQDNLIRSLANLGISLKYLGIKKNPLICSFLSSNIPSKRLNFLCSWPLLYPFRSSVLS
jgi:hypothetical protein